MAITKAGLRKELHSLGIKTYKNKTTGGTFVRRGDVKKVLAGLATANLRSENFGPGVTVGSDEDGEEIIMFTLNLSGNQMKTVWDEVGKAEYEALEVGDIEVGGEDDLWFYIEKPDVGKVKNDVKIVQDIINAA